MLNFVDEMQTKIIILISGAGSNAREIIRYFDGNEAITVCGVVSSKENSEMAQFCEIHDHRKDTLISSVKMRTETLRYHLDAQQNYTRYNNYQRPYLEVSSIFNPDGYLTQEQTYFRISQTTQTTFFTYNETGLLAKKSLLQSENTTPTEEWRYRYDQWGNLIEIHFYKEGVFLTDYQIVYDYKTGFLGSLIHLS